MWIKIRDPKMALPIVMPVPLGMASLTLRCVPEDKLHLEDVPVTKEWILEFLRELRHELRAYRGLVLVEVEDKEGRYIKITV